MIKKREEIPDQRITYRIIDKILCRCLDVGCDSLVNAARNRRMISSKEITTWWLIMEAGRNNTPARKAFPSWIPQTTYPVVSRTDWRQNSGERGGEQKSKFFIE